jgi:hypothetical protein
MMKRRGSIIALLAICCAILVIAAVAPLAHPRIPMNHMRTAHSVIQLMAAERQYAARFPAAGFTCDLRQLAKSGMVDTLLASGEKAGYQYELHGCGATASTAAFSVSAVPTVQGRTGEFAFCGNQEGVLWYAGGGSADECFRVRTRWNKSDPLRD